MSEIPEGPLSAGANVWGTGGALQNPEISDIIEPQQIGDCGGALGLTGFGSDSDVYSFSSGRLGLRGEAVSYSAGWAAGTLGLTGFGSHSTTYSFAGGQLGLEGQAKQTFALPQISTAGGALWLEGEAQGYAWGTGEGAGLLGMWGFASEPADYSFAGGQLGVDGAASDFQIPAGGIVYLPGLTGPQSAVEDVFERIDAMVEVQSSPQFILLERIWTTATTDSPAAKLTPTVREQIISRSLYLIPYVLQVLDAAEAESLHLPIGKKLIAAHAAATTGANYHAQRSFAVDLKELARTLGQIQIPYNVAYQDEVDVAALLDDITHKLATAASSFTTEGEATLRAQLQTAVADLVRLVTRLQVPHNVVIQDVAGATVAFDIEALRMLTVLAAAGVSSEASTTATLIATLASASVLRAHADCALSLTMDEALALLDEHQASVTLAVSALEEFYAACSADNTALFVASTDSTVGASDMTASQAQLRVAVAELAGTFVSIRVGNELIQGWVVNTKDQAFSEYQNFPFNSLCEAGGRYFAVAEDGLYELAGGTDAGVPIQASIKTGLLDLGTHFIKDVKAAYIGYNSAGRLLLYVTTTNKGSREQWWYELKDGASDSLRDGRVTVGRGLRAKYWQFEVVNLDGADFELDDIQIMYNVLSRRTR